MSEYWKSTPKYHCQYCNVYVRDTKLERSNHEKTVKHQGAKNRFLRDLHRTHDQQVREKERAQREIDRLNGVVRRSRTGSGSTGKDGKKEEPRLNLVDERKRQVEQLVEMGVAVPEELKGGLAMAGEWQVTNVRVIEEKKEPETKEARAIGMRKREVTEEEKEEEEALRGLFKKSRKWGRDSKAAPVAGENKELDELLSMDFLAKPMKKDEEAAKLKFEMGRQEIKEDEGGDGKILVKVEEKETEPAIKSEPTDEPALSAPSEPAAEEPVFVFKKRKAKNIRQK